MQSAPRFWTVSVPHERKSRSTVREGCGDADAYRVWVNCPGPGFFRLDESVPADAGSPQGPDYPIPRGQEVQP